MTTARSPARITSKGSSSESRLPRGGLIGGGLLLASLLLVDPWGWDHFGPLRFAASSTLAFVFVARHLSDGARPTADRADVFTWVWCALLAWGAVASAFGADPLYAWIGTPDRRFGFVLWLGAAGVFYTACRLDERSRHWVVRSAVIGAIGVGAYCVFELADWTPGDPFVGDRLGGPWGQPAYLGAAMALVTPAAVGVAATKSEALSWRITGAVGAALGIFALLGSQSRAAWVGVALAMCVWAVRRRAIVRSHVGVAASGVAALVLASIVTPVGGRVASLFDSGGVVGGRLDEWKVGLRALTDAPLLGYGPEGYRTVFGQYVDDGYVIAYGRDVITDRAHNGVLDVALSFGLPGGLLYAVLLLLIGRRVWAVLGAAPGGAEEGVAVGVLAFAAAQMFLFPLAEVDLVFWMLTGLIVAPGFGRTDTAAEAAPRVSQEWQGATMGSALAGLALGLAAVAAAAGTLDVIADHRVGAAVAAPDPVQAAADMSAARALRPDSIRYAFISARLSARVGDLDSAVAFLDGGLNRSPHDPALLGERAAVLLEEARIRSGPDAAETLAAATAALESLTATDPNHPEHLQRLGIARALSGDFDGALVVLRRAHTLAPARPEPQANIDEVLLMKAEAEQEPDLGS